MRGTPLEDEVTNDSQLCRDLLRIIQQPRYQMVHWLGNTDQLPPRVRATGFLREIGSYTIYGM